MYKIFGYIKKTVAFVMFFSGILLALWITFHVGFLTGYHTCDSERGKSLEGLERRGLITAEAPN